MISQWVPDWELLPWDYEEGEEEEKAVPCLNCYGRGRPTDHPQLRDLRLPRVLRYNEDVRLKQGPVLSLQNVSGHQKPVPRVGKGRAQILRERALRIRSEKSVGSGPSSVCSDDSLSVCSDTVLVKSSHFPESQFSTPPRSIAGDRPENPMQYSGPGQADNQFSDPCEGQNQEQGSTYGLLELSSDSDNSSSEGFGEASSHHSMGSRERGYAFNLNYSNMNKNSARFDSMELGDFIPAKLPLRRSGGFGHSGRVRQNQQQMDVNSIEEFPLLGAPAPTSALAAPPSVLCQNDSASPNKNKEISTSMKTIASSIAKEPKLNSLLSSPNTTLNNSVLPESTSKVTEDPSTGKSDHRAVAGQPSDGSHRLSITGLPADCSRDVLQLLVADYGEIISCKLKCEADSCSAIICMETEDACDWAVSCLDGCESSAGERQIHCFKL